MNMPGQTKQLTMQPIGWVRRNASRISVEVLPEFRDGLKELKNFSHVCVFWWADRLDDHENRSVLVNNPPYAPDQPSGVFASRSPCRPNPIMMTVCKIIGVDEQAGTVEIGNIDTLVNTPVVDLKAYFPITDRVQDATIPSWLAGWPEWFPADGIGLSEGEPEDW